MDLDFQCDVCFVDFDLENHRPKVMPCGHTICKECIEHPGLQRKCPTCRKVLADDPGEHPDNVLAIRLMEKDGAPPRKKPRTEDTTVQQLQRGVDAGRKVVDELRLVVPLAVDALHRQLESSIAQLRQMEEALEQQVRRQAARDDEGVPLELTEQLQVAAQLEHHLRLLTTNKCSVVAEEEVGAAWRASVQLGQRGGLGDGLRLLLLQLQTDGQLATVENVAVLATPVAYVGRPMIRTLRIEKHDLDGARLKVSDILRDRARWTDSRSIWGLKGEGAEELLRVLAPQLEELEIKNNVTEMVMEEVQKMASLKRLDVSCNADVDDYPALPLQLEELEIERPCHNQLCSVDRMSRLRSLSVWNYFGPDVTFTPSGHGALRWLDVSFKIELKATMLSLIRSCASSLQVLQVVNNVSDDAVCYFPDLAQDLAGCGLQALRRLVLYRSIHCSDQVAACMIQRRAIRDVLPSSVEVLCTTCDVGELYKWKSLI